MAYKFQLGEARLSGSTTFEESLAGLGALDITGLSSLDGGLDVNGSNFTVGTDGAVVAASLSVSDGPITNVSDIALDSISADDGSSFSMGSNWTNAGRQVADLGTIDTVDINGGSIDGATIGAASQSSVKATTLSGSGNLSVAGNAAIQGDITGSWRLEIFDRATIGSLYSDGAVFTSNGTGDVQALTFSGSAAVTAASFAADGNATLGGDLSAADIDASGAITAGASGFAIGSAVVVETQLEYLDSAVAGTAAASKVLVLDANRDITNINDLTASYFVGDGSALTNVSSDSVDVADSVANSEFQLVAVAASGDGVALITMDDAADAITINASTGKLTLAGPGIAIGSADVTEAEFEFLDGATAGTAVASKALVVDASKDLASLNDVSAAGLTLSDLTSGRVLLAGTSGLLEDNADLAYNGSILMVKSKDGQSGSIYTQTGSVAVLNAAGNGYLAKLGNDGVVSGSGNFETGGQLNAASSIYSGANIEAQGNLSSSADLELAGASRITAPGVSLNNADLLQIDGITPGTVAASKAVVVDSNKDIASFRHLTAAGAVTAGTSFVIGSADLNEADMEKLDGITNGTAAASKAVVLDGSKDISGLNDVQAAGLILSASSGGFQSSDLVFGTTASPLGRLRTYDDDGYITELSSEGGIDLSGSEGIAALMPSGMNFLVVGTGTHSLMLGDLDDNYNVELSSAGAISGSSTLKVGGNVTMAGLGTSTVDLTADLMIINDNADGSIKNTSLANYSTAIAGAGLLSTAGVIAVVNNTNGGINVAADAISIDFNDLSAASVNVAADSFAFLDADGDVTQKESIADLVSAMAGTGITATAGVLSVSAASTPTAFGDEAATMVEGLNYASATLTAPRVLTLPNSDDLDPGEFVKIKLAGGVSATNYASIVIDVGSGDLIDGDASIRLESPYAAVDLYKVAENLWRIL